MTGHDVIVVGGGPGGATTAYLLEQRGHDTLIVDKEMFPRDKLCGGIITHKTARLLDRVYGRSASELHEDGVIDFESGGYRAYFDDELVVEEATDPPFHFADREVYDAFLFETAREAGADAHLEDGVTEVDPDAPAVLTSSGERFEADYVVGADGAHSRVRRELADAGRVDDSGWQHDLAIGVEAYVDRDAVDLDTDWPLVHFGVVEWGYGWVFPNRDRYLVGVGGLNRANGDFRGLLRDYLDQLDMDVDPAIKGRPIPFGNYLDRPGDGRVLLVGDAAGTVDAITGEGIFYAQRCGELAATSVDRHEREAGDPAMARYRRLVERHVHPELHESKRVRPAIWAGPKLPRKLLMRAWMALLSDPTVELVQGIRVYGLLRRQGERMHDRILAD